MGTSNEADEARKCPRSLLLNLCRTLSLLVGYFAIYISIALPSLAQNPITPQAILGAGPYTVHPALSTATCMDVSGGTSANGAAVQAYSCNGTEAQSWSLLPITTVSGSGYQFVASNSQSCLNVAGTAQLNGAVLQQMQCGGAWQTSEVWKLYAFGSHYELVSSASGKCLDLPGGNSTSGTQLQQWDCDNGFNPNQLWTIASVQSGVSPRLPPAPALSITPGPYLLQPNSTSTSCMDVSGGSSADGTAVQLYSCNGTRSQAWSLVPVTGTFGNAYELVAAVSGSCLAITGSSMTNGAKSLEWHCQGSPQLAQLWQLYSVGTSYELVSLNSGKCLDLPSGSTQNGNQLQQWDCDNGANPNQIWNLIKIIPTSSPLPPASNPPIISRASTTTTNIQATPTSGVAGQTVVLSGKVSGLIGSPSGSIAFVCDSVMVGTVPSDNTGVASLSLAKLATGPHTMSAQYLGSAAFAASTSSAVQVTISEPAVGEQAFQADSFVDSVGVQTHLTYGDTGYYTLWPLLLKELKASGVRHLRDGLWNWAAFAPYTAEHQALAAAGIRTTYGISLDYTMTPQLIKTLASSVGDLEALEAPNECDAGTNCGGGGAAGINNVVAFMPYLAAVGKVLQVPVIGPSFTVPSSYANSGDLSSTMASSNLHVYFAGANPGTVGWGGGDGQGNRYGSLAFWLDQVKQEATLPVQITETGYIASPSTSIPYTLPESVEASYTPRTLLLAFNHGVQRTFLYELLDEVSSPGYGLLRSDGTEKPAFIALKGLLNLLSDPGTNFTPGKLSYSISGGDASLSHTLLQKRDGSFWLVLWSEQSSYNASLNKPINVAQQNALLTLSGSAVASQLVTFDATGNAKSTNLDQPTKSLPLAITDQLTLIHITPP